jgi:hypothetical protein
LIAPGGGSSETSHRAHVLLDTSTCLDACANDNPIDFLSAFNSAPVIKMAFDLLGKATLGVAQLRCAASR